MNANISRLGAAALFVFMSGLYSFSFFQRVAVPGSIFNDLQVEFAVSAGAITALSSIYLFIYAGQQFFIGMLTDRFGGVKVTLAGGVFLCLGAVLFTFSKSMGMLYFSHALVGLGAGAMYLSGIKEIDKLFRPENFAPLVGVFCVIGYSGGLLGTRPFRGLVDSLGWRQALLAVAILAVVFWIGTFLAGRGVDRGRQGAVPVSMFGNIGKVFRNPRIYPLLFAGMINFSIYFSFQSTIGPKFLGDFLGIEAAQSTRYTFFMMLSTLSTMLISGPLTRILGNRRKPFIVFASFNSVFCVSLILCTVLFKLPAACFMVAFAMLAVSAGLTPVIVSFVKELNHRDAAGLAVGTQNTATYLAVAFSASLIGFILDLFRKAAVTTSGGAVVYPAGAYLAIFWVMLAFAIISVIWALKTQETKGVNVYAEPKPHN
jgi:predicted MFS family arabinose efflux permease